MQAGPCKVCAIGGGVVMAISTAWGWATSIDLGRAASEITVLGGAICGVLALLISTIIGAWSKARAEAWATSERIRMQVKADEERLESESLTGQIKRLTETVDEAKARVEDANAKLHDAKNQANADALERSNQVRDLKAELTAARRETHEAREELQGLRADLRAAHAENTRLMGDIRRLQATQGQQIRNNRHDIDALASKSSDEIPTGLAPPPPDDPRG